MDSQTLIAASYLNKEKYKKVYIVFGALFILSLIAATWAYFNWDNYSETYINGLTGRVREIGLAPTLFGWGLGLAACILFIFIILWSTLDFKNPSVAISSEGLFLNKEFFSKIWIFWDEFSSIQQYNEDEKFIELSFANPESIVNKHKGISKLFLKQNYIKDQGTLRITEAEDAEIYTELLKFLK